MAQSWRWCRCCHCITLILLIYILSKPVFWPEFIR
ncbi:hypothetical protein BMETH_1028_0 [methanotrophic bacterial endosymbiont of Bathymodiolus sp.]|nr:hypothetical protein BMETH_1028_0 [methanotrophic bacterial endosymbiont of Bathymodiolus sp.]